MALAAFVNTGSPSQLVLPAPQAQTREARTVLETAGETLPVTQIWNGKELSTESGINLIPDTGVSKNTIKNPSLSQKTVVKLALSTKAVESAVETYFADIPIMIRIAGCESQFRQMDAATGEVLRGVVNSSDRGVMQINEMYHGATAKKLGLDILTLEGNMAYARHLYEEQGTRPWISSSACWSAPKTDELARS